MKSGLCVLGKALYRAQVQVVVVIVRYDHYVNPWQILEGQSRADLTDAVHPKRPDLLASPQCGSVTKIKTVQLH